MLNYVKSCFYLKMKFVSSLCKIFNSDIEHKIPFILKFYIYFNYIIGITFGGLVIRDDHFVYNRRLKSIGNLTTILSAIAFVTLSQLVISDVFYKGVQQQGFYAIYLFITVVKFVKEVLVVINLVYLQTKSDKIFTFLAKYPVKRLYNWIIVSVIFLINCSFIIIISIFYIKHYIVSSTLSYSFQFTLLVIYRLHVQFVIQMLTYGIY